MDKDINPSTITWERVLSDIETLEEMAFQETGEFEVIPLCNDLVKKLSSLHPRQESELKHMRVYLSMPGTIGESRADSSAFEIEQFLQEVESREVEAIDHW